MKTKGSATKDGIVKLIEDFITASPENALQDETGEPAWDDVLVGFASGADPIRNNFV